MKINRSIKQLLLSIFIMLLPALVGAFEKSSFSFYPSAVSAQLSSNTVTSIVQDSQGYLWLASQNGLYRYDGTSVHLYSPGNEGKGWIGSNVVVSLVESRSHGGLWALTDKGIYLFNRTVDSFEELAKEGLRDDRLGKISDISIFPEGCGYEIVYAQHRSSEVSHLMVVGSNNKPVAFPYKNIPQNLVPDKLAVVDCSSGFLSDHLGRVFKWEILSEESEIQLEEVEKPGAKVERSGDLMVASNGVLWFSTESSGITSLSPGATSWTIHGGGSLDGGVSINSVSRKFWEDKDGIVWAATGDGLVAIDRSKGSWLDLRREDGLPSDNIVTIYQDRSGVYWVGTVDGLASGVRHLFKTYSTINGLSNDSVNAFSINKNGEIWVGTDDGLNLVRVDGSVEVVYDSNTIRALDIPDSSVMSLLVEDGNVWVGTARGGLGRLDEGGRVQEWFAWNPNDKETLSANGITSIQRSASGRLLIGTYGGGLNILELNSGVIERHMNQPDRTDSLSDNHVLDIMEDSIGRLWIGTERGLNIFDIESGVFREFGSADANRYGLGESFTWLIEQDQSGRVWVGTRNGLYFCSECGGAENEVMFERYADGAANLGTQIYSILPGSNGEIWVSHNNGLSIINLSEGEPTFLDLSREDDRVEFNFAAGLSDDEGRYLFGHNRGFTIIDPRQFPDKSLKPRVVITGLEILGSAEHDRLDFFNPTMLELRSRENIVSLDLSILDYLNPKQHKLSYMIEGLDREWIDISESKRVSLARVPFGDYFLRVRVDTSYGISNPAGFEMPIVLHPPLYRSRAAYYVYGVFLACLIMFAWLAYSRGQRDALMRERRLEYLVSERTRELELAMRQAEAANQAKSAFLATITHEIRTPLHGILGMNSLLVSSGLSGRQREFADCVGTSGRQLLELINSVLDFSKVDSDSEIVTLSRFCPVRVLEEISLLYFPLALDRKIDIAIEYGPNLSRNDLVVSDENKLRHILRNLIGNAVKFTREGIVVISVRLEQGSEYLNDKFQSSCFLEYDLSEGAGEIRSEPALLKVSVKDTGIGIPEEHISHIFEAFYQVDSSDSRSFGGTGLGLAISKRYVDLLGGEITVKSDLSIGSSFSICVPIKRLLNSRDLDVGSSVFENQGKVGRLVFRIEGFDAQKSSLIKSLLGYIGISSARVLCDSQVGVGESLFDGLALELRTVAEASGGLSEIRISPPFYHNHPVNNESGNGTAFVSAPLFAEKMREAIDSILGGRAIEVEVGSHMVQSDGPSFFGAKVLVVEDIVVNQKIVDAMLTRLGCTVILAANGSEAVSLFERDPCIDLILMDCQMPIMDGYEACLRIRALESAGMRTPIVAMTATAYVDDFSRAQISGMDYVLQKPYVEEELIAVLQRFVNCHPSNGGVSSFVSSEHSEVSSIGSCEPPSIDEVVVKRLIALEASSGSRFLIELISRFEVEASAGIKRLHEELNRGQFAAAGKSAHALKSAAANLGAKRLVALLADVESQGGNLEIDDAIDMLQIALDDYLRKVGSFITVELSQ